MCVSICLRPLPLFETGKEQFQSRSQVGKGGVSFVIIPSAGVKRKRFICPPSPIIVIWGLEGIQIAGEAIRAMVMVVEGWGMVLHRSTRWWLEEMMRAVIHGDPRIAPPDVFLSGVTLSVTRRYAWADLSAGKDTRATLQPFSFKSFIAGKCH